MKPPNLVEQPLSLNIIEITVYWVDLVLPRTAYQNCLRITFPFVRTECSKFALFQQFDSPLNLRVNEDQIPLIAKSDVDKSVGVFKILK